MTVTREDLDDAVFEEAAHYNMGSKGFGYGYRCARFPRLSFIDRYYRPTRAEPDGKQARSWFVDGAEVGSESIPAYGAPVPDAALAALNVPPVLTDDERTMLALVPWEWRPLRQTEDDLAGVERPAGGIMVDTPHSRVLNLLHSLRDKGMVEYGKTPERSDGRPWGDSVPGHMRWSPTIRRRPGT